MPVSCEKRPVPLERFVGIEGVQLEVCPTTLHLPPTSRNSFGLSCAFLAGIEPWRAWAPCYFTCLHSQHGICSYPLLCANFPVPPTDGGVLIIWHPRISNGQWGTVINRWQILRAICLYIPTQLHARHSLIIYSYKTSAARYLNQVTTIGICAVQQANQTALNKHNGSWRSYKMWRHSPIWMLTR